MTNLNKLYRAPWANLMTVIMIGITLALPASLFVMLHNTQGLTQGWNDSARVSLFLQADIKGDQMSDLLQRLLSRPDVAEVTYISPEQGLAQLQQDLGIDDVMEKLPTNPLPGVIEVLPTLSLSHDDMDVEMLVSDLTVLPQVEAAQLDVQWVKRLYSILYTAKRGVYALGLLLAATVLLVIANTIRLAIENEKEEIEIVKLVGGTNAFVSRPFLYMGVCYGFFGGFIAWIVVNIFLWWMHSPIQRLMLLYQSQFQWRGLGFSDAMLLMLFSMLLGWLGSWFVMRRYV